MKKPLLTSEADFSPCVNPLSDGKVDFPRLANPLSGSQADFHPLDNLLLTLKEDFLLLKLCQPDVFRSISQGHRGEAVMQTFWEAQQNLQLLPHHQTAPRQTAEGEVASRTA